MTAMKRIFRFWVPAFLTMCSALTVASMQTAEADAGQDVKGEVVLTQQASSRAAKDSSKVAVWLVSRDAADRSASTVQHVKYKIVQRDKAFHPDMLVVPVGSVVDFPNLDPWFHNVFSLYRGKRFDLGLYEAGSDKQVRFDRLGVSYIFCNIHPEMTAVVLTVDSVFSGISDRAGHFVIPDVPPGRYVLHVWYENATPEALDSLTRPVSVGNGGAVLATISIETTARQDLAHHKNKYGKDYDPQATGSYEPPQ